MELGSVVFLSILIPHESASASSASRCDIAGILVAISKTTAVVAIPGTLAESLCIQTVEVGAEQGEDDVSICLVSLPIAQLVGSRPAGWKSFHRFPKEPSGRPQLAQVLPHAASKLVADVSKSSDDELARKTQQERVVLEQARSQLAPVPSGRPKRLPQPAASAGFATAASSLEDSSESEEKQDVQTLRGLAAEGQTQGTVALDPSWAQAFAQMGQFFQSGPAPGPSMVSTLQPQTLPSAPAQSAQQIPYDAFRGQPYVQAPVSPAQVPWMQGGFPQAPPGAAPASSTSPQSPLLPNMAGMPQDMQNMMFMWNMFQTMQKSANPQSGRNQITRAFNDYQEFQDLRTQDPHRLIREFELDCVREERPREGQVFTYRDVWASDNYTKCRSLGRMTYILQEICEELRKGNTRVAYATAIQGWKAGRQYAQDGNQWRAAWHLTCLPDPFRPKAWRGNAGELAAVGGYLKAESDLVAKIRQGAFPTAPTQWEEGEGSQDEEGEGEAPKKKKKKPKGGGKGDNK